MNLGKLGRLVGEDKPLLEKDIERYLCDRIKELGGAAYKYASPSFRARPDRLIDIPGEDLHFVECKRPGAVPTKAQAIEHKKLRANGRQVYVIDTKEMVDVIYPAPLPR